MGEVDVKYHQFSYLVNSPDELAIENFLVYQNYTGTCKIVCLSFRVFSSRAGFLISRINSHVLEDLGILESCGVIYFFPCSL